MVTPSAKRKAAKHLVAKKGYSVQMACKTVELQRSTYYYEGKKNEFEERLIMELGRLSKKHPRYGYPKMTQKLRQLGWRVNKKRVQRLWRALGLKIAQKQQKRRRTGASTRQRQEALYPNHVWSWDFLFDRTEDGRSLKILNIVDEYSRYNMRLEVGRHFRGEDVISALGQAMLQYGIPGCIRSDNGSEFISDKVKQWLAENGIGIMYIEPASPWENPYVESLNNRLRDECLNRELISHLKEAQVILDDWREEYNQERPHGSLYGRTPQEVFAEFISPCSLRSQGEQCMEIGTLTRREYLH